jgi:hypothetical protein
MRGIRRSLFIDAREMRKGRRRGKKGAVPLRGLGADVERGKPPCPAISMVSEGEFPWNFGGHLLTLAWQP